MFRSSLLIEVQWASLKAHTKPPYTLTLKANGCIIFIAALTPKKLVVNAWAVICDVDVDWLRTGHENTPQPNGPEGGSVVRPEGFEPPTF